MLHQISKSYLGIEVCIISTAQHAKPKVIQCKDPALAQLIKLSKDVVIKPLSAKFFANSLNSKTKNLVSDFHFSYILIHSQSSAPFFHSYINPTVSIDKKIDHHRNKTKNTYISRPPR